MKYRSPKETDQKGPMHKMFTKCKKDFFLLGRTSASWATVQNHVVDYLNQKGVWLDGKLIQESKTCNLEAFWEQASISSGCPELKDFLLNLLSHVVDSADSERLWSVFQNSDPKGRLGKHKDQ